MTATVAIGIRRKVARRATDVAVAAGRGRGPAGGRPARPDRGHAAAARLPQPLCPHLARWPGASAPRLVSNFYVTDWSAAWTNVGIDLPGARGWGRSSGAATLRRRCCWRRRSALPPAGAILPAPAPVRRLEGPAARHPRGGLRHHPAGRVPRTITSAWARPSRRRLSIRGWSGGSSPVQTAAGRPSHRRPAPGGSTSSRSASTPCCWAAWRPGPQPVEAAGRRRARRAALRIVAIAVTIAVPWPPSFLTAPVLPGDGSSLTEWGLTMLKYKIDVLRCALVPTTPAVDYLFFAPFVALIVVAAFPPHLGAHQGLLVSAAGLIVLSLIAPQWAAETAWVDTRLPIMALLTLLAALEPQVGGARATAVVRRDDAGPDRGPGRLDRRHLGAAPGRCALDPAALAQVPEGSAVMPLEHRPSVRGKRAAPVGPLLPLRRQRLPPLHPDGDRAARLQPSGSPSRRTAAAGQAALRRAVGAQRRAARRPGGAAARALPPELFGGHRALPRPTGAAASTTP